MGRGKGKKKSSFGYEWESVRKITCLKRHNYSMFLDCMKKEQQWTRDQTLHPATLFQGNMQKAVHVRSVYVLHCRLPS